jgi:adenylate cyclase
MPGKSTEHDWQKFLTEGESVPRHFHHLMGLLPSNPRCKLCNSPFKGWGGYLMHLMGRDQSRYNPRYCEACEQFENPGGAVIELTMLFADVRGSTRLAEQLGARDFSALMNRFYLAASAALIQSDALVDRLIGDEAIGLYVPVFAGARHPRRAVQGAQDLLRRLGESDPAGPWLPVGIGVHTGSAWVGVVGGEDGSPTDFTALGDNVSLTARLASAAGAGEILIIDAAYAASGLNLGALERRQLELKGVSDPTSVRVLRVPGAGNPGQP